MVAAADDILAALDDPQLWIIGPERNVFDEHVETRPDGTTEVFDAARLSRLAANSNARDQKGQPCPMTVGHTKDDAAETDQPPIVGYWRYFRVAWDERLGKWVIRARPYVRRDQATVAEQYPRVSVERWADADFFDPIAILRRTPRLDVGQWTYARPNGRIRYAMGDSSMPGFAPPPAAGGPPSAPPATPPAAPPGHDEEAEYAKFCGHMKRYEAEKVAPPEPPADPAAPPRLPPAAPPPGKPEGEAERMQKQSQAIQYSQLQQEIAVERYARRRAEAERECIQLQAEGYRIDRAKEVEKMAALTEAGQAERVKEIRENYSRAPIGGGFVQTARVQEGGGKPTLDRDGMARAQKYQRDKGCTWEAAVAHELGTGA